MTGAWVCVTRKNTLVPFTTQESCNSCVPYATHRQLKRISSPPRNRWLAFVGLEREFMSNSSFVSSLSLTSLPPPLRGCRVKVNCYRTCVPTQYVCKAPGLSLRTNKKRQKREKRKGEEDGDLERMEGKEGRREGRKGGRRAQSRTQTKSGLGKDRAGHLWRSF